MRSAGDRLGLLDRARAAEVDGHALSGGAPDEHAWRLVELLGQGSRAPGREQPIRLSSVRRALPGKRSFERLARS